MTGTRDMLNSPLHKCTQKESGLPAALPRPCLLPRKCGKGSQLCLFHGERLSKLSSSESLKLLGFKWEKYTRSINTVLAASSLPTQSLDGARSIYVILHRYLLTLENI